MERTLRDGTSELTCLRLADPPTKNLLSVITALGATAIGRPFFASSAPAGFTIHTAIEVGDDAAFQSYRLAVGNVQTNGLAPGRLAGVALSLDAQPGRDRMRFVSETDGVDEGAQADPFADVLSRVDLNTVTADIRVASDKRNLMPLPFTASGSSPDRLH